MNLYGKKIILRAVEEEDIEMVRQRTNTPEFEEMVVGWTLPLSTKDQKEWYQGHKNDMNSIRFTIESKDDGAVGMIHIGEIDWKNGAIGKSSMRIDKKDVSSKGLATDAWMTLMKYIFDELRLNRVAGSSLPHNTASLRVCEKVGFKIEGTLRQAVYKNGKFHDVIILGCTKEDYLQLIANNHYWDECKPEIPGGE